MVTSYRDIHSLATAVAGHRKASSSTAATAEGCPGLLALRLSTPAGPLHRAVRGALGRGCPDSSGSAETA